MLLDNNLQPRDIINYTLSAMAFIMSLSAFLTSLLFQSGEKKRNVRIALTNALNEISKINVELAKLSKDVDQDGQHLMNLRNNFNVQRGSIIADAEYLIQEIPQLLTAVDCHLMASTFQDIGNEIKAEHYWTECIQRSHEPQVKHLNIREYASFLFSQNQIREARDLFHNALKIELTDNDNSWMLRTHTCLQWARLERSFRDNEASLVLLENAKTSCEKIRHKERQDQMKKFIESVG